MQVEFYKLKVNVQQNVYSKVCRQKKFVTLSLAEQRLMCLHTWESENHTFALVGEEYFSPRYCMVSQWFRILYMLGSYD